MSENKRQARVEKQGNARRVFLYQNEELVREIVFCQHSDFVNSHEAWSLVDEWLSRNPSDESDLVDKFTCSMCGRTFPPDDSIFGHHCWTKQGG